MNNIQQFLEEERNRYSKEYDNLIDDREIGELEADDLLEDHDTRLINFILSEVEKGIELEESEGWSSDFKGGYRKAKGDLLTIISEEL